MVHEPKLRPLFEEADSLETLGKRLIDAANAAGGRDNITVILFRLEEVERAERDGARRGHRRRARGRHLGVRHVRGRGRARAAPGRHAPAGVSDDEVLRSSEVADTVEEDYRRSGTVALSAIRPSGETEAARGAAAAGRCGQIRDGDARRAAPPRSPAPPAQAAASAAAASPSA